MSRSMYFAKVPLRNTILGFRNRIAKGNALTQLLRTYDINLVLDIGANKGQYGRALIKHGYQGRIVSFEPLPDAFARLSQNRWGFASWQVENLALGAEDTTAVLNIAGNSQSSSLQAMHPSHVAAAPESAYIGDCTVMVRRLDSVFDRHYRPGDRCYMKMDVQGHESQVLQGASGCLDSIVAIESELSMVPLYEGQMLWNEAIESMKSLGFELASISPGFRDRNTSVMLQADGVFIRAEAIERLRAGGHQASLASTAGNPIEQN